MTSHLGGEATYNHRGGYWCRADKLMYVGGRVGLSGKGTLPASGAYLGITGMPFGAASSTEHHAGFNVGWYTGVAVAIGSMGLYIAPGGAFIYLTCGYNGGAVGSGYLMTETMQNGFDLIFGGCYRLP